MNKNTPQKRTDADCEASIPVSRSRAFERFALRFAPGLAITSLGVFGILGLNFARSAVRNRITEYAYLILLIPITFAGIALLLYGLKWLLMAIWPAPLRILANSKGITFETGPMGTRHYDLDRLTLVYGFEDSIDIDDPDAVYESLIDPRIQIAEMLPRMRHPNSVDPLERRILHFARMSERQAADRLRPFTEYVRRDRPAPDDDDE